MEKDALFSDKTITTQFYNDIKKFLPPQIRGKIVERFQDTLASPNDTCDPELLSNIIDDEYAKHTNGFHRPSTKSRIYALTNLGTELQRVITQCCMQRQSNILDASKSLSSIDKLLYIKKEAVPCLRERLREYKQWSLHKSIGIAKAWQQTKQLEHLLSMFKPLARLYDYRNVLRFPHLSFRARIALCVCIIDEIRLLESKHDRGNLVIFQNLENSYRNRLKLLIRTGLRQLDNKPNVAAIISFFKVLGLEDYEICQRGLDLLKKDLSSTTLCTIKRYCNIEANTPNDRKLNDNKMPVDIKTCSSLLGPNVIILTLTKLLAEFLAFFARCLDSVNGEEVLDCLDGIPDQFKTIVSASLLVNSQNAKVKICQYFPQIQAHTFKLVSNFIEATNLCGIKDSLDLIKMACLLRFFICFNKVGICIDEYSIINDRPQADVETCEIVNVVRAPIGNGIIGNSNLASLDTVCSISTEAVTSLNSFAQSTKDKTGYSTVFYSSKQSKGLSRDEDVCFGNFFSPCRVHYEIYKEAALILPPLQNSSADFASEMNRLEDIIKVKLLDRYLDTIELACTSKFDSVEQAPSHMSHYYRQRVNFSEWETMFEQKITQGKCRNSTIWISSVNPFIGWTPNSPFLSLQFDSKLNVGFESPFVGLEMHVVDDIVANFGAVTTGGSLTIWSHFGDFACAATLQSANARQYINRFVSLLDIYINKLLSQFHPRHLHPQPSSNILPVAEANASHFWRHLTIIESCRCLLELVYGRVDIGDTEIGLCVKTFCLQKLKLVAECSNLYSEALVALLNSKVKISTPKGSNMPYIDAGFRALKQQLGHIQEHMRKLPEPVKGTIWAKIHVWATHKQQEGVSKAFEGVAKGYTSELLRANFAQVIQRISSIHHYHQNRLAAYKRKYWNNIKEMGVYQKCC